MSSTTARSAPPIIPAAGGEDPVVGPDEHRGAARHLDRDRLAVGAHAGIDDGEDHPGTGVLHRPGEGQATGAHVERRDLVGEVDDVDPGRELADDRLHDADELVARCRSRTGR